jgi:hypothetical protein
MLFKAALINVQQYTNNMEKSKKDFYTEHIPEEFTSIKQ